MRKLAPAEAAAPSRARQLLRAVGADWKILQLYAARNYFERPLFNLTTSALHVVEATVAGATSDQANLLQCVQPV